MITKDNFKELLEHLNFEKKDNIFKSGNFFVDFTKEILNYPEEIKLNDKTTSNFSQNENFVVFEAVFRLVQQGYNPQHIELEKKWQLGHSQKSGKADIYIKDNDNNSLIIIECKTAGGEYKKAVNILENDSRNQLFSYLQQASSTKFVALYSSDFIDNKIVSDYYLINVTDNIELLKNEPNKKGYRDAPTSEDKYAVWVDTYEKEYATIGLFEDNQPYQIGKSRFNIDDLKRVSSKDIQGKYHQFATILRKYNVSGREQAFDKLVNLFLCKAVDEVNNQNDLKFYWKGRAYDNPFDFQDRLQSLYKDGMKEFLNEEITHIENSEIDEAFELFKDKPNATKEKIKEYFHKQKFFTNSDFSFIDVHNNKLFYQNFEVLLKIVHMIQDISLTKSDENQFLGDMFEGFLDQGVKQSEGQFFTPMPIVKFIINSLPDLEKPKVIDYACGSGHFLNEYAVQNRNSEIFGIEKEYRLSKVSKVSSFMYGSQLNIIYDDALKENSEVKNSSFDVLIANPPYSVKGFLETLTEKERRNYKLFETIDSKSLSSNNSIETFFIERAKQLLKKDGVAGIIVPSSILNKGSGDSLYVKTREIILSYFDIVAIAEFGSGTFGKTGTNTVTLFLRRKSDNPPISEHLKNMVDEWFNCDFEANSLFKDSSLLNEYLNYMRYSLDIYRNLLCNRFSNELFEYEVFREYKTAFEKLTETTNRKKKKFYKELSEDKKRETEERKLIEYIRDIERDKLLYFSLSYRNSTDVLVVKAPSGNSESKKFLGYEWSSAKGDEGIKYITSSKKSSDEISSLKDIQTPLYNPEDIKDGSRINSLISKNFSGEKVEIPEELKKYVSTLKLVDMLDFSGVEFNKSISTTAKRKVEIETKWDLVKLGEVVEVQKGKSITQKQTKKGDIKVVAGGVNFAYLHNESNRSKNIITVSASGANAGFVNFWKEEIFASDCTTIKHSNELSNIYIFHLLKYIQKDIFSLARGSAQPHVYPKDLSNLKIPLPPIDIQEKIVSEIEIIDDEVEKAKEIIYNAKSEIEILFENLYSQSNNKIRLTDKDEFDVFIGKRVLSKEVSKDSKKGIPIFSANVFEPFGYTEKEFLKDFKLPSILWGIDGDWQVNHIVEKISFFPTDHCGVIRVKGTKKLHYRYLTWVLNRIGIENRFSRHYRASTERIKNITIEYPPLKTQQKIVSQIEDLEKNIDKANSIIEASKDRKSEILEKYLK